MKKRNLLWLALALFGAACTMDTPDFETQDTPKEGNPYFVSVEEAIEKADQFFALLDTTPGTRTQRVVKNIEMYKKGNPLTRSSNVTPEFYVINYVNDEGFALMSTDSRKLPVYAFSTEGQMYLADTTTNPGLRYYLNTASTLPPVIGVGPTLPTDPGTPIDSIKYGELTILVSPLLAPSVRNWDQFSLNKYVCPNPKDNIPVGCAALATAQIMSYFQWPLRWPVSADAFNKAKERYTFNWEEMIDTTVNDEIARLVEILGRKENLNIDYKPLNSVAPNFGKNIKHTLDTMGYKAWFDRDMEFRFNSGIVLNTLYKKSPVLVGGKISGPEDGHIWTVDGAAQYHQYYKDLYYLYYHCVWGQGGKGNGYFYYDADSHSFSDKASFKDKKDVGDGKSDGQYKDLNMVYEFIAKISKIFKSDK